MSRAQKKPLEQRGHAVAYSLQGAKVALNRAATDLAYASSILGSMSPERPVLEARLPAFCDLIESQLKALRALLPG